MAVAFARRSKTKAEHNGARAFGPRLDLASRPLGDPRLLADRREGDLANLLSLN
jgi:hypothetical protein